MVWLLSSDFCFQSSVLNLFLVGFFDGFVFDWRDNALEECYTESCRLCHHVAVGMGWRLLFRLHITIDLDWINQSSWEVCLNNYAICGMVHDTISYGFRGFGQCSVASVPPISHQQLWECPPATLVWFEWCTRSLTTFNCTSHSRRSKCSATSSPAQSVVGGTSPGNCYQKATEESIDLWIMWMEDDHLVDIAEKWKRPPDLKLLTKNSNASQLYDQLVGWTT